MQETRERASFDQASFDRLQCGGEYLGFVRQIARASDSRSILMP